MVVIIGGPKFRTDCYAQMSSPVYYIGKASQHVCNSYNAKSEAKNGVVVNSNDNFSESVRKSLENCYCPRRLGLVNDCEFACISQFYNHMEEISSNYPGLSLLNAGIHGNGCLGALDTLSTMLIMQTTLLYCDVSIQRNIADAQRLLLLSESKSAPEPNLSDVLSVIGSDLSAAFVDLDCVAGGLWPTHQCSAYGKLFDVRSSMWDSDRSGRRSGGKSAGGAMRLHHAMANNLHSLQLTSAEIYPVLSSTSKRTKPIAINCADLVMIRTSAFSRNSSHSVDGKVSNASLLGALANVNISRLVLSPSELAATTSWAAPILSFPTFSPNGSEHQIYPNMLQDYDMDTTCCPGYSQPASMGNSAGNATSAVALVFESPYAICQLDASIYRAKQALRAGCYLHRYCTYVLPASFY